MFFVQHFDELDSTNSYLKRNYSSLEDKTVIVASHQTSGRGRLSRTWEDDSHALMFSILLKKDLNLNRVSLLPLLVGVSLVKTLEEFGFDPSIKWPNDILLENRKCAGILLESIYQDKLECLIVGVGLNVNNKSFPKELENKAVSLSQISLKEYIIKDVLDRFLDHFEKDYEDFLKGNDQFLEVLKSHFYLQGRKVHLNYYGEDKEGEVIGIDENGNLLLSHQGQIQSIRAGEVTLENNY